MEVLPLQVMNIYREQKLGGEAQPPLPEWGAWLRPKQAGTDIMGVEGAAEISHILMGTGAV